MKPTIFPPRRHILGALLSACSLTVLPLQAGGETTPGWFAWPSVLVQEGSALDMRGLNEAHAGVKGRILVKDGHFVTADGRPLRFWGGNLGAHDAFPEEEDAVLIARRLSRAGVNIVRLHHLDNPWGVESGGSLWPKDRKDHQAFDPAAFDKLHRLMAALKAEGVYSNLNLKVSKALSAEDGFDASVSQIPDFNKRVDIFCRRMIDLQKDYARRLLTTRNPYTGLSPAEDPAVAVVEINNENSIMGFWVRDLGRGLDKFPKPFTEELRGYWNQWLAGRYPDEQALARAWQPEKGSETRSLVPPSAVWQLKVQKGNAASLVEGSSAGAFTIAIGEATGIDWHVQASIGGLSLRDGAVYTVEFEAKADQERRVQVGVSNEIPEGSEQTWRSFGLLENGVVGTEWTKIRLVFPSHSVVKDPGSLALNLGHKPGQVSVRNLRLHEGCLGGGLPAGQSPKTGTVALPREASARQWADWLHFLAETERAFAVEMRTYLRDELKLQAPLICTQVDYGALSGLWRERDMEFADSHVYWQHPEFGGSGMWDPKAWSIKNSPQLAEFGRRGFGELGNMAMIRVAGKPFTLSEYDHAAPSEYVAEMYPVLASFASRQDWDGVYPFAIGAYGKRNPDGRIDGFFDQLNHPVKWAFTPFAALSFRRGLVPPASRSAQLSFEFPYWAEQPHADVQWRRFMTDGIDFLNTRLGLSDRPNEVGAGTRLELAGSPEKGPVTLSRTPQGPLYVVQTPQAAALVGYLGGAETQAGSLKLTCPRFGRDFAAVTAVSLDGRPLGDSLRVLVTLASRAENSGVKWNATRTSFGTDWGRGPALAERVPALVSLQAPLSAKVYPLAPDGSRRAALSTRREGTSLVFSSLEGEGTLHYEVVVD